MDRHLKNTKFDNNNEQEFLGHFVRRAFERELKSWNDLIAE